jgi:hypothetical protein
VKLSKLDAGEVDEDTVAAVDIVASGAVVGSGCSFIKIPATLAPATFSSRSKSQT